MQPEKSDILYKRAYTHMHTFHYLIQNVEKGFDNDDKLSGNKFLSCRSWLDRQTWTCLFPKVNDLTLLV